MKVYLLFREKAVDEYYPSLIGAFSTRDKARDAAGVRYDVVLKWKVEYGEDEFAVYRTTKIGSYKARDYFRIQLEAVK
ncbi:hypothetical protein LCGC14_1913660 [marine sediment metagenome]|uniref:Uncharacterized protein n=1 Tax=marine sediment metagenome TaxID=412755 RepID=A0A0F9IQW4_9ZZZZ